MRALILVSMVCCNLFSSLCYSVIVPFLPLEFEKFGLEVEIYGYIYAAYAASAMFTCLIVGKMLSYCGRRIILISGMIQLGCAMISYGFIHFCPSNLILTIVCICIRALEGASSSMILTTCYSVISISYRHEQTKYLGFLESSSGFGMLIGPIIGSVLYTYLGFELSFFIIGGLFIFLSPMLYFIVPKDVDKQDSIYSSFSVECKVWSGVDLVQEEHEVEEFRDTIKEGLIPASAVQENTLSNSSQTPENNSMAIKKLSKKRKPISLFRILTRRTFISTAFCGFLAYFEYCYMEPVMSIRLEEFGLGSIVTGLYFSIYYIMYTIGNLCIFFFTNRFDSRAIIVFCLFMCGLSNFLIGPSPFLPNTFILMCVGQFFNGAFTNFLITCLPVMIDDVCKEYPRRKNEVSDISSGVFTLMLSLGQTFAPIYGSNMVNVIGFRWCADLVAYLLIFYSIVYLFIWKVFERKPKSKSQIPSKLNYTSSSIHNTVVTNPSTSKE